jgi:CBS domain-containing protein
MIPLVCDYMNTNLVYLREGDRVSVARKPMLDFGVSAVPILDETHRPVALVTFRDLAEQPADPNPSAAMTIAASATIEEAARILARSDVHHLVVVDTTGKALGILSALDVVRGLLDLPARHPEKTTSADIHA